MIINHHNRGGGGVGEWTNDHIKLHLQLPHTITRYQVRIVVIKSPGCPSLPVRVACTAFMALACQSGLERLVRHSVLLYTNDTSTTHTSGAAAAAALLLNILNQVRHGNIYWVLSLQPVKVNQSIPSFLVARHLLST